jgi:prophage regulatory protein
MNIDSATEQSTSRSAPERFLNRREVEHLTGLGRSTLYRLMADRAFPKPIPIMRTSKVVWLLSDVEIWMTQQLQSHHQKVNQ